MSRRGITTAIALVVALGAPAAASAANVIDITSPLNNEPGTDHSVNAVVTDSVTGDAVGGVPISWGVAATGVNPVANHLVGSTNTEGQFNDLRTTSATLGSDVLTVFQDVDGDNFVDTGEPSDTATISNNRGTVGLSGPFTWDYQGPLPVQSVVAVDGDGVQIAYRYVITGPNGVTDGPGVGVGSPITWPSTNVGTDDITAYRDVNSNSALDSGEPQASRNITVSTGSVVLSTPSSVFTDSGAANVNVTVRNGAGALTSGTVQVNWSLTGANGPASGSVNVTGGTGTITVPGSAAGTSTLTATYDAPSTTQDPTDVTSWTRLARIVSGAPSSGITSIVLSPTLQCQVHYAGDTHGEFYSGDPGACNTFLFVGGAQQSLSAFSQTAITGAGTRSNPFRLVTEVQTSTTGIRLRSTISFVNGEDYFQTDLDVLNSSGTARQIVVGQHADCYLGDSDSGYGYFDAASNGIYCSKTADNNPVNRIEGYVPISGGSTYAEGSCCSISSLGINGTTGFANTCTGCNRPNQPAPTSIDNAMGIAWVGSAPAGGSTSRSYLTAFSPTGITPDLTAPSLTIASPASGSQTTEVQPLLSGGAGTAPGDAQTVHVDIYSGASANGTPVQSFDAPAASGTWSGRPGAPLALGQYTARATQSDSQGHTGTSAPSTFTVVAVPSQAPPPPPAPPPAPQVPPPTPDKTGNVRAVSGKVCVILPKAKKCTPIDDLQSIPVGTIIDTTKGTVELTTAADAKGKTQTGTFNGGQILFDQVNEKRKRTIKRKGKKPLIRTTNVLVTMLSLRGGGDPDSCDDPAGNRSVIGTAAKRRFSRYVKAKAHGRFRVKGRESSGVERGTAWTTKDDCRGTLTTVTQGAVLVTDFAKKKDVLVKAPGKYLANGKAKKKRKR